MDQVTKEPITLAPEERKDTEDMARILDQMPASQCRLLCLAFDIARALTAADETNSDKCPA